MRGGRNNKETNTVARLGNVMAILHVSCGTCHSDSSSCNRQTVSNCFASCLKKNVRNRNRSSMLSRAVQSSSIHHTQILSQLLSEPHSIVHLLGGCSSFRVSFSTHHRTKRHGAKFFGATFFRFLRTSIVSSLLDAPCKSNTASSLMKSDVQSHCGATSHRVEGS